MLTMPSLYPSFLFSLSILYNKIPCLSSRFQYFLVYFHEHLVDFLTDLTARLPGIHITLQPHVICQPSASPAAGLLRFPAQRQKRTKAFTKDLCPPLITDSSAFYSSELPAWAASEEFSSTFMLRLIFFSATFRSTILAVISWPTDNTSDGLSTCALEIWET